MEEHDNPIFLNLSSLKTIFISIDRSYLFFGNNNEQYEAKEIYELVDPSIDATFKFLLAGPNTELLSDVLNSLLFPDFPFDPQLTNIEIINNEVVKPAQKQNKGTIRADIACTASYKGETIILGIEMQIGISKDFTIRLLNYNVGLRYRNGSRTTWTLGLLVDNKKNEDKSSYTRLNKMKNEERTILNALDIGELDLHKLIEKINKNEEIYINEKKIGERGKEWIKLLGIRTWCTQKMGKFIIPKDHKLSNNTLFIKAIKILSNTPIDVINNSLEEEEELRKYFEDLNNAKLTGQKQGKIEGKIQSSFDLFISGCEAKFIMIPLLNNKYQKDDVYSSLEAYSEKNKDHVEKFIYFLKENNFLLD